MRRYYVYILASHSRRLYVGVTNDLVKRLYYHRSSTDSFVAQYRINRLVYYEDYRHPMNAIAREKQIKGWVRRKDRPDRADQPGVVGPSGRVA